uniref:Holliday junction resolvase n=1 Tax=Ignisphaera aggregans TaxID=334771 RepID=A0A7J2U664_9CREN
MGFAVIRGPASGSRIKKAIYPDIVAIKNSKVFVLEVKKRKELRSCYLDSNQLLKIAEFAKRAGGEALVAIKIDSLRVWKVLEVSKIVPQGAIPKRIKVDKEVIDKAEELFTYLSRKLSIGLEKFIQFQE